MWNVPVSCAFVFSKWKYPLLESEAMLLRPRNLREVRRLRRAPPNGYIQAAEVDWTLQKSCLPVGLEAPGMLLS